MPENEKLQQIVSNLICHTGGNKLIQFCLEHIAGDQYKLLRSYQPEKNKPGNHCKEIAKGTIEEMTRLGQEIRKGLRDHDGHYKCS